MNSSIMNIRFEVGFISACCMKDATPDDFGIGTVIFNPGKPRHAAIVVDMLKRDVNDCS